MKKVYQIQSRNEGEEEIHYPAARDAEKIKEKQGDEDARRYVLDIFVDKVYLYEDSMIVTFHFIDDKQELSYDETLEMIENHAYLVDSVNDPEAYMESGSDEEQPFGTES